MAGIPVRAHRRWSARGTSPKPCCPNAAKPSSAIVARALHDGLRSLGTEERLAFYRFLAANFRPDADPLRTAAAAVPAPDRYE
jgi:hypothetical protein